MTSLPQASPVQQQVLPGALQEQAAKLALPFVPTHTLHTSMLTLHSRRCTPSTPTSMLWMQVRPLVLVVWVDV